MTENLSPAGMSKRERVEATLAHRGLSLRGAGTTEL